MIRYVAFKKFYKSKYANYKFFPNVKYMLKREDDKYYYTIKDVRLPKENEFVLYNIMNAI